MQMKSFARITAMLPLALLPPQWAKPVVKRICPHPKISGEDGSFYKLFCCGSGSLAQSAIPRTITEPEKLATREAAPEVPKTLVVDSQKLAPEPLRPAADMQNPIVDPTNCAVDPHRGHLVEDFYDNRAW